MSRTLPPDEWLRERLPEKLQGPPGETFIGVLHQESSFQRIAYDLGFEAALAYLSGPVVEEPRLYLVSDADELMLPPAHPRSELELDELDDADIVADAPTDPPPPDSAA